MPDARAVRCPGNSMSPVIYGCVMMLQLAHADDHHAGSRCGSGGTTTQATERDRSQRGGERADSLRLKGEKTACAFRAANPGSRAPGRREERRRSPGAHRGPVGSLMLVDVNILLFAVDARSPSHARARDWLTEQLNGVRRVGFSWLSLAAFVRISTNPRASDLPLTPRKPGSTSRSGSPRTRPGFRIRPTITLKCSVA